MNNTDNNSLQFLMGNHKIPGQQGQITRNLIFNRKFDKLFKEGLRLEKGD